MKKSPSPADAGLFSHNRLVLRQMRAIRRNAGADMGADFLIKRIAEDFAHRISATNRNFANAADFFSLSDKLSSTLDKLDNVKTVSRYELPQISQILPHMSDIAIHPLSNEPPSNDLLPNDTTKDRASRQTWPHGLDLCVSAFGLHSSNNLPQLMARILQSMKADGLVMIALPVKGTLNELRDCLARAELELTGGAASRVDPFIDLQQAGTLLQTTGFKLPVVDREDIVVRYDNLFRLVADLRLMGATSALNLAHQRPAHRHLFKRADELYRQLYSDADGRIRASFCLAYLTGWAPHQNQQQPLKPGSAKISLAKHLKLK